MLVEQEIPLSTEPLFLDQKQRAILREEVLKAVFRFPRLFNRPLYRSFELLVVNSPSDFLSDRSIDQLRLILCTQFFLQKKIETTLKEEKNSRKQLFLKLFRAPTRICVALVFSSSLGFQKDQLLAALDEILLPGVSELSNSYYLWHSPDLPYFFCYFEVDKLRGRELTKGQLRAIEKTLTEQMLASAPLTPAIFWPYNKEESHRQTLLLIREMASKQDLPHVSIHFKEQTATSLEFLIHLVRPKSEMPLLLEKLPESISFFRYSHHTLNNPFQIEIQIFSIKLQAQLFDVRDTINLLYARRYIAKQLEVILGPFRDYNGGLFEKQQDHFEMYRLHLGSKIPCFDLFAEKVFYALHPFEKWFSLTLEEVEDLFRVFSEFLQMPSLCGTKCTRLFTVIKTENKIDSLRLYAEETHHTAYAQLTIGNFHYECFSGEITHQIQASDKNTLRLVFQEGAPPSLNPHYSSGDMRCRLLNKMLFEGLTRLNQQAEPELAGASSLCLSPDQLSYTFQLRKANWSNGEKVTAFDYADTWKWALQDLVSHPELVFSIKNARKFREKACSIEEVGIRVIDSETLQIELEAPDSQFLHKLAQPFFFPLFGTLRQPKWFNGPYLVQKTRKNGLKLERNPYFWRTQETYFEYIDVQWTNDNHAIYERFKTGKIDWIGDPVSILAVDQIRELEKENRLQMKSVPRRFSLYYNTKHPILSSIPVRQALSLAIDRSVICNEIFPHSTPIEPKVYSKELAKVFFQQGLRELGMTRNSFPILTFSYSNQTRRDQLAEYLQSTWAKTLGIQVRLDKHDWNTFRSHLEKRNFEICGTIQDTLNEDSANYLERFEGSNSWNFSQWSHLVYRELIANAKIETDPAKQLELTNQAEKILFENIPFVPLFNYVHLYAHHPRIESSYFDPEGCIDFSKALEK